VFTSADDLKSSIQILQSPPYRDSHVYVGYYRIVSENTVNVFYARETKPTKLDVQHNKRRNRDYKVDIREHNFYMVSGG